MRRLWIKLCGYFRNDRRIVACPRCGFILRARSGPAMTDLIADHDREHHPNAYRETLLSAQDYDLL